MPLYERYELLELRRDDGIQTFHARDIATARPVQIHMFPEGESPENRKLLARLDHLPEAERRRLIERGDYKGRAYVVTDRLAGYAGFREWLTVKTDGVPRHAELDEQFHQLFGREVTPAGQRFDPDLETMALIVSPIAAPTAPVAPSEAAAKDHPRKMVLVVRKSLLGILLGILAAIVLLALLVAGMAFLPR